MIIFYLDIPIVQMINIIYSFDKSGFEAEYWSREIGNHSNSNFKFIPFNTDEFIEAPKTAQELDELFYKEDKGLIDLYDALNKLINKHSAKALLADNSFPYHPDFLKTIDIYKVIRLTDGPMVAYSRELAYLHAYDHALYPRIPFNKHINLPDKLEYCGLKESNFWPLGSFDALCDRSKTSENIFSHKRDIDVLFIGALHIDKMPMLAKIKKRLGKTFKIHGLANLKKNLYFNAMFGFPGWVTPIDFNEYVPLYQRAKIGINIHLQEQYTLGGYRMFDLPANGVFQISDGGEHLNDYFEVGKEIEGFSDSEDLCEKIDFYLKNEDKRNAIALNGFKKVNNEYTIGNLLTKAGDIILLKI